MKFITWILTKFYEGTKVKKTGHDYIFKVISVTAKIKIGVTFYLMRVGERGERGEPFSVTMKLMLSDYEVVK